MLLGISIADAQTTYSWSGLGSDSLWSSADNWNPAGVPGIADTAVFSGGGNGRTTVGVAGATVLGVQFDSAAAAYTLGTGTIGSESLRLADGGTLTMTSTVATNQTVNAAVALGTATAGTYTILNGAASNSLLFAGSVAGGTGGTAGTKTLLVTGVGPVTMAGVIGNGGSSSVLLRKTDPGTLTLSATNTFSGNIEVQNGTVRATATNALGSGTAGSFIIGTSGGNTGLLELSGGVAVQRSAGTFYARPNTNSATHVTNVSGTNTLKTTGNANFNNPGTFSFESQAGTLILDFAGMVRTNDGNRFIVLKGAGDGDWKNGIKGLGTRTVGVTKQGEGTWSISGPSTYSSLSGSSPVQSTTAINGGVLAINHATALPTTTNTSLNGGQLGLTAAFPLFDRGLGTGDNQLQLASGSVSGFTALAGTGVVNIGAGTALVWGTTASWLSTGALKLGSANAAGTVDVQNPMDFSGAARTIQVLNGSADVDAILSGTLTDAVGSGGGLTKDGAGTLVLTGANTYSGATTIAAGTLRVGAGSTAGSILGDVALSASNATLAFNRSDDVTFAGAITGSGQVRQVGLGRVVLGNAGSNYSGGTFVDSGTLAVTAANALGTGNVSVANGARLQLSASPALAGANAISLASGAQLVTIGSVSAPLGAGSSLSGWSSTSAGGSAASLLQATTATATTFSTGWDTNTGDYLSDILTLDGTTASGSNVIVLSMAYDAGFSGGLADLNIFTRPSPSGTFAAVGSTFAGVGVPWSAAFQTPGQYGVSDGRVWAVTDTNSQFVVDVTVVPEPGALALVAGSLALIGLRVRRRLIDG